MPASLTNATDQPVPSPVMAEVMRGDFVESTHHGRAVVVDADGAIVWSLGDIDQPIFPRSAVKCFQALPFVESGAPDRFDLTREHLALACGSHSGLPEHTDLVADMLARAGLDETHLACGTHWPLWEDAARELSANGLGPTALHNNCSGKHAGFLCLACAIDAPTDGYVEPTHEVQAAARAAIESVTGWSLTGAPEGRDGCSIPAYALPLRALALGFARFGTGAGLQPQRANAAYRLRMAVQANPNLVSGPRRFDAQVMGLPGVEMFTKTGAEGVLCAALPELGLGLAVKCADGSARAAEATMAALLKRFVAKDPRTQSQQMDVLEKLSAPVLRNWAGTQVGILRVHPDICGPA